MKKLFKWILISVVCVVVLVGIAGYVVLANIDFNDYKQTIAKAVYDATGRKIEIGNIQIKPSFIPVVELQDVSLANAEWAKEPNMVTVKGLELGFSLIPLLHKNLVVDRFYINDAVVNLEENPQGGANWEFAAPEPQKVQVSRRFELISSAYAAENDSVSNMLSSLVIKQVALENVLVNYTAKNSKKQSYQIQSLTLDENADDNIDFDFNVNKGQYQGKGVLGALSLLDSPKGYPVISDLIIDGIGVTTDLKLFDVLGNIAFDGKVSAKGFLGKNSGYSETADVVVKGNLTKIEAVIEKIGLAGNVVTGKATVDLSALVPAVNATLQSEAFNIAPFMAEKKTAWTFSLIKEAQAETSGSQQPLPYDALKAVNAVVEANIASVVNENAVLAKDVVLNANVANGQGLLNATAANVANGKFTANVTMNAQNQSVVIKADVAKLNLQKLFSTLNIKSDNFSFISGSDMDVSVDLSGNGASVATLMSDLDGRVVAIVDKSELHLGNVGMMKGNVVTQLLNTLNITKGNDNLNLRCAVVRTDIKKGLAQFPNSIVVNADKFTVVANGDVNLQNDKISLSVKPFAGKLTDTNIAKALSSLVKLTGTIQNPKIRVDTTNAIKTIVGVTTAGPVYLGAQMLLENDGSPCYTALQGTGYEDRFPKGDNIAVQTTDEVGKILDDSVDVVKSTTKGLFNILTGDVKKVK